MSSDAPRGDDSDADTQAAARAERERRRRAAELLGDLLPSTTSDERDPGSSGRGRAKGGTSAPSRRDDELMRDVPPHHGG